MVNKILNLLEKKFSNNLYIEVDEDENFEKNVMAELVPEDGNYEHFCIRINDSFCRSVFRFYYSFTKINSSSRRRSTII